MLSGFREEFRILNFHNLFQYHTFLKKEWLFIWTDFNFHHSRMICAKFRWNKPGCNGEEDKNLYRDRRTATGRVIRKAQLSFQPYKRPTGQIAHPRNISFLTINKLSKAIEIKESCLKSLLSPTGKGHDHSFKKTSTPIIQGCFVPNLVKLVQWFWREWKCESLQTDGRMDDRQLQNLTWHANCWSLNDMGLWFFTSLIGGLPKLVLC